MKYSLGEALWNLSVIIASSDYGQNSSVHLFHVLEGHGTPITQLDYLQFTADHTHDTSTDLDTVCITLELL